MLDVASENTSLIAAQLIMEFLARIVESPLYRKRHPVAAAGRRSRGRVEPARRKSRGRR